MIFRNKIQNIFPEIYCFPRVFLEFSSFFLTTKFNLRFTFTPHTIPYFSRRITRSMNDVPSSKSIPYDKDLSHKKPIRNIFILLPGCQRAALSHNTFFYFVARRGNAFHGETRSRADKARQRNDTVPRSTGRVIFTGRKWSNSALHGSES